MKRKEFHAGKVVKFRNSNGTLNGGTIVNIDASNPNERKMFINTLDGDRVIIEEHLLIPIQHQRQGTVSEKFKKRILKEIAEYNEKVIKNSTEEKKDENNHVSNPLEDRSEEIERLYKKLKSEADIIKGLEAENKELRDEIERLSSVDVNKLIKTVIALKKSILSGLMFPEDTTQAISPLLDLITELNDIKCESLL